MSHSSFQESSVNIEDIIRDIHAVISDKTDKHVSGGTSVFLAAVGVFIR